MTTRIYVDGYASPYFLDGRGKAASMSQYPDHGCREATRYLGKQSECLECPFEACRHDDCLVSRMPAAIESRKVRNNRVLKAAEKGLSIPRIAAVLGLKYHTVYRILQSRRNAHG